MRIQTILNKTYKFKSFVYKKVKLLTKDDKSLIEIEVIPRKNSQAICSSCHRPGSCYDHQGIRRFEHVPLWNLPVVLCYNMRRVNCDICGVKIEWLPWSDGKVPMTKAMMQFLGHWAKKLSWSETATCFQSTWHKVYQSIKYLVEWGLAHRQLDNIESIGIDEISWKKGQNDYLTLVYQIDKSCRRLLWIGKKRTVKTGLRFFRWLGKAKTKLLKHICSDMWSPYIKVIKKKAPQALHILDRFHIVANLNKAIDKVRASEHKQMQQDGFDPILTHSRWCLLKRQENLTEKQEVKLKELLKYNLKTVRAYLLKEDFQGLWEYVYPAWAEKFLDRWCTRAMRSKLDPIKTQAKSIRKHKQLILNWFKAKKEFSSGIVEGFNNKIKLATKKAYGFKSYSVIETALYHQVGMLPQPPTTHRFS